MKVTVFPKWKGGESLTAADRLHELALLAERDPHLWKKFVLVRHAEGEAENTSITQGYTYRVSTIEQIGLLELGKLFSFEDCKP